MNLRNVLVAMACSMAVLLAGCAQDVDDAAPVPTDGQTDERAEVTTPALTAPPTTSPEDEAEQQIQGVLEDFVADWDNYRATTSDYHADDEGQWVVDLVDSWPLDLDAYNLLLDWAGRWSTAGMELRGESMIVSHDVVVIGSEDGEPEHAESEACLDMTELEPFDYDGQAVDLADDATQYQAWNITWANVPDAGWTLIDIDVTVDEPCEA
ncbi:hypothetical protein [Phytoactinopolyspora mesophila]|uniref:Lipoprotein n=1 Tax=Phytoactinopolyspora mesophila TaxID=2650750 RepID=A0A7K3M156_9ACTN|nr:hypothetical protein [Phytoactinopolyspora mesophila]NDL57031.1 hypothetical protein [Phytoactinopolyspora mesophila]